MRPPEPTIPPHHPTLPPKVAIPTPEIPPSVDKWTHPVPWTTVFIDSEDNWIDRLMFAFLIGLLTLIGVPLLIVTSVVWVPIVALGWVVVKIGEWWERR